MKHNSQNAMRQCFVLAVCVCVLLYTCTTTCFASGTGYANIANSYSPLYDVMFKTLTPLATLALCFSALRVLLHDPQNAKVYTQAKRAVLIVVVAYAAFIFLPAVVKMFNDILQNFAWDPSNPGN